MGKFHTRTADARHIHLGGIIEQFDLISPWESRQQNDDLHKHNEGNNFCPLEKQQQQPQQQ